MDADDALVEISDRMMQPEELGAITDPIVRQVPDPANLRWQRVGNTRRLRLVAKPARWDMVDTPMYYRKTHAELVAQANRIAKFVDARRSSRSKSNDADNTANGTTKQTTRTDMRHAVLDILNAAVREIREETAKIDQWTGCCIVDTFDPEDVHCTTSTGDAAYLLLGPSSMSEAAADAVARRTSAYEKGSYAAETLGLDCAQLFRDYANGRRLRTTNPQHRPGRLRCAQRADD